MLPYIQKPANSAYRITQNSYTVNGQLLNYRPLCTQMSRERRGPRWNHPAKNPLKIIGMCLIANLLGATLSQRTEAFPIIGQGKLRSFFFVILHHQDKNGYLED